jgi:hypothetical protein
MNYFVSVDRTAKAVVLTCRGTLGLQDLLTDLTFHYDAVHLRDAAEGAYYYAHSGMLASAKNLARRHGAVHDCLKRALEDWPSYGLVLTGHRCACVSRQLDRERSPSTASVAALSRS